MTIGLYVDFNKYNLYAVALICIWKGNALHPASSVRRLCASVRLSKLRFIPVFILESMCTVTRREERKKL